MSQDTPAQDALAQDALKRAAGLACWSGPVTPEPLTGGITNLNFVVDDGGQRYFVRIGAKRSHVFQGGDFGGGGFWFLYGAEK